MAIPVGVVVAKAVFAGAAADSKRVRGHPWDHRSDSPIHPESHQP